ncbi:MAG: threonine synthase [Clostridia bacterium]|nr:threonine synthase [Clostridia bacterium]
MNYVSTRDREGALKIRSAEAIKRGLAPDGGLFMPERIPTLSEDEIVRLAGMKYEERAAFILGKFLDDYDPETLAGYAEEAYSEERFPGGAAPLREVEKGLYSLELWHGPTCAFKDMALQIMPRLLSGALRMTGERRVAHILVATSGDTGKAALEGFRDVDGVRITVFYPEDGVSAMQKLQMTTQEGENVSVCAVKGNFDDAQTGVKRIFSDPGAAARAEERNFFFSSANSINWGRLAPQIVYYASAYCDLLKAGAIKYGDPVNVTVPTGNFGNIFAGYIARRMGVPIKRFVCASNSNRVLTDFIETGVYDRNREFFRTASPSMDILISSNLERLLCVLGGPEATAGFMAELSASGRYEIPEKLLAEVRSVFSGYSSDEAETFQTIRDLFDRNGYLCDPHSAVAFGCAKRYIEESGDKTPMVVVSTASPYKFSADVLRALGEEPRGDTPDALFGALSARTGTTPPKPLLRTATLPVRFTDSAEPRGMDAFVFR